MTDTTSKINRIIADLEDRLAAAKQLRDLLAGHPLLAEEIFRVYQHPEPELNGKAKEQSIEGLPPPSTERGTQEEYFQRIMGFLLSKNNEPHRAPEIMAATGLTRSQVSQILYKSHRNRFARVDEGKEARRPKWKLSDN